MGNTSYNPTTRSARSAALYEHASTEQIFQQRDIHESLNPKNIRFREARDGEVHPNTYPAVAFLDVTGSMLKNPEQLIKQGLPHIMEFIIGAGIPDFTLLFGAIGDHISDRAPLQLGQFESGDAELDASLTNTWLEAGGGGGGHESYLLAWMAAAYFMSTDSFEKRGVKGTLFTIGDEWCHPTISRGSFVQIFGEDNAHRYEEIKHDREGLLEAAQQKWNVYHIHLLHTGSAQRLLEPWRNLLGENCLTAESVDQIPELIRRHVLMHAPMDEGARQAVIAQSIDSAVLDGRVAN